MDGTGGQEKQTTVGTIAVASVLKTKRYRYAIIAGLALGLACAALMAVSTRYSFAQVNFAGQFLSNRTSHHQIESDLNGRLENYEIITRQGEADQKFKLTDAGLGVDAPSSAEAAYQAKMPKNLLKRLMFWRHENIGLKINIDEKKFDAFVSKHLIKTTKAPKDAAVNVENGKVVVSPEKAGSGHTLDDPKGKLLNRVEGLKSEPLELTMLEIKPDITVADTEPAKQKAETYLSRTIVFDIDGVNVQATRSAIGGWLEFSPVKKDHTIDVTVNGGKVLEYLSSIAGPYIHPPRPAILIPASAGQKQVLIPGANGVDIIGKEDIAKRVTADILSKPTIKEKLSVKYQTFKTVNATLHDKWLAVDLTNKRMYAYEKTKLVRTFLVSAGAPETPTVEGSYKIYRKFPVQDMFGANADGSRYFAPGVRYVNYFHADYAIHGNHWRPLSYFGNINSSHGCVGIVNADAEWIYNWAPIGTTVLTFR